MVGDQKRDNRWMESFSWWINNNETCFFVVVFECLICFDDVFDFSTDIECFVIHHICVRIDFGVMDCFWDDFDTDNIRCFFCKKTVLSDASSPTVEVEHNRIVGWDEINDQRK